MGIEYDTITQINIHLLGKTDKMKSTDNRGNLHLNSLVEYNIIRKDRFREIRLPYIIADSNLIPTSIAIE